MITMPSYFEILWLDQNITHIAEHGITPEEVEQVLREPIGEDISRTTGNPIAFGYTVSIRKLAVVYAMIDEITIYPITAYDVE